MLLSILRKLLCGFSATHPVKARHRLARTATVKARPRQPTRLAVETLEDRCTPSTILSSATSVAFNFNNTPIAAGNTVWFSSELQANGLGNGPVNIQFTGQTISFTASGTHYSVNVPNSTVTFTSATTTAATTYSASKNSWTTTVPIRLAGGDFLGGVELAVPNGLPGGITNVTWQGQMTSDTSGVTVQWHGEAAVYKQFSTDYTALGVKPVDDAHASSYQNNDKGGTPEAFKASITAGATGTGGNNYTGNASPNVSITPPPPGVTYIVGSSTDYPFVSSNPLTSVAFNENECLTAAALNTNNNTFEVWYTDEHAMILGVNQLTVIAANGTSTTTNYPVAAMSGNPSSATNPAVGAPGGLDPSGRPQTPTLYVTDITTNTTSRIGDWQYGGTGYDPNAVFGTWKSATETINNAQGGAVTVSVAADPAQNGTNLGAGADAPPPGLQNQGYIAEVRWNLSDLAKAGILLPGHNYRFYVMIHDGDQNKTGGDVGQASYQVINPIPGTDLVISKVDSAGGSSITGSVGTVTAGDGVVRTYTITVTNTTVVDAQNVSVTDTWPAGFTQGTITDAYGTVTTGTGGSFTAALGTVAANSSKSITVTYTVPSSTLPGLQTNTVTVTSSTPDVNPANNTASDTDNVLTNADLAVTKVDTAGGSSITGARGTVTAGDGVTYTYTIAVTNNGPSDAQNVTLADTWPAGFTEGTITDAYGAITMGTAGNFTAALGTIVAGATKTITVTYKVPSSTLPGLQTNTVTVSSSTPDSNLANNTASDTDVVLSSDNLSIAKLDDAGGSSITGSKGTVTAGDGIVHTYTITVTNSGPSDAQNVSVADTWPAGFTEGTITDAYGAVTLGTGGNFTAALGTIFAGGSKSITVSYTVPASTTGDQTNTATVSSGTPNSNPNNTASDTDHVLVVTDLAITKTDNSPTFTLGESLTYVITVTNSGPSDSVGALVADLVPSLLSGVTWTSSTTGKASVTSGGSGSGNNLAATVNIAAGPGNSVIFLVNGTVPTDWCMVNGDLVNTATVAAPPGVTDPNLANNSATDIDTLSVGQHPITVNSAGDDPSGPSAGIVTLRDAINAVNLGSADAILFAIPGTPTINLTADLPVLNNPVFIDGTTDPGVIVNGHAFTMLDLISTVNVKDVNFTNGTVTVESDPALEEIGTLNVESDFNVGSSSTVNNNGNIAVCGSFIGGDFTAVNNFGNANFTTDGNFVGGFSSSLNNYDLSSVTVGGNLTLGDFGSVSNHDVSSLGVIGNFTLGNNGFMYNGVASSDSTFFSVGGNFTIGNTSAQPTDFGFLKNYGSSTINVGGDFTIFGDGGSSVFNGVSSADSAVLTVGGSFRLGANSSVADLGTSSLSLSQNFTLGANSFFDAAGSMSVGGSFDPGTGNASNPNVVSGTFTAASGSSVTTNSSTWVVVAGGQVDVAAGATFTVANNGTLLIYGNVTVAGLLSSVPNSLIVIEVGGALTTQGSGQLNILGTLIP
jgi:uncharacterized repeat protein (TIGR01451 family)